MSFLQGHQQPHRLWNVLDVLIIGGGPAGLSAALALGRVLRSAVVFDSGEYRNEASNSIHTVPMHDCDDPANIRRMKDELQQKYKTITFAATSAERITEIDGIFEVQDGNKAIWKGRKVILATGNYDVLPDIPGFKEAWGKKILNCAWCRGFEEKEVGLSNAAFLVAGDTNLAEIDSLVLHSQILRHFTQDLALLLNGHAHLATHAKISSVALALGIRINPKPIQEMSYTDNRTGIAVTFSDGSEETFGFLFHQPRTRLRGDLAEKLGLEVTQLGDLKVEMPMQLTSRRGVFAAGDCATTMKQVAVAMGTGVSAGIAATVQIAMEDVGIDRDR